MRDEVAVLASRRRMALFAAGGVVLLGLAGAIVLSRRSNDPEHADGATTRAALQTPSREQPPPEDWAILPVGGKLPAGSSRDGFVIQPTDDGRRVARVTGPSKVAFRLAPTSKRYGVSAILRLSGAKSASLTPNLDGKVLPSWQLSEGWSFYTTPVDGDSLGTASKSAHDLLFTAGNLPAEGAIDLESILIAPIGDRASFDAGPRSDGHWIDGFHRRERGAIWSRGMRSVIGVALEPKPVPYRLNVRGRTLSGLGPLGVKASVNEHDVGIAEVTTKVEDVTWSVPADVLESGANRIVLEYPKTGKPASFNPSSDDTRELAFRISSVELAPAD